MKGERIPTLTEFLHMAEVMRATHTPQETHDLANIWGSSTRDVIGDWQVVPLRSYVAVAARLETPVNFYEYYLHPLSTYEKESLS